MGLGGWLGVRRCLTTVGRRFPLICRISGDRIIITIHDNNQLLETIPTQSYSHPGSVNGTALMRQQSAHRRVSPIFRTIPEGAAPPDFRRSFLPKMPDVFRPNFPRNLPLTFLRPSGTILIT
jgi:hypothetical protein